MPNGTASVIASGGTAGYTYLWDNTETTPVINNLSARTYTVTVTDANFCTSVDSVVVLLASVPVITLDSTVNVLCNGGNDGAIYISVSGGTPAYAYLWSNTSVSEDIVGLITGTYTVTVTDADTCTATQSFSITQPTAVAVIMSSVSAVCNLSNGIAISAGSGGTGILTYLWNNSLTNDSIFALSAGVYTCTVADSNLCTATDSVVVTQAGSPSIALNSVLNVSCNGGNNGAIDVSINQGTPIFSYQWSTSATSQDLNSLAAGVYTLTVTDANLCTDVDSFIVTQPTPVSVSFASASASCALANGSATAAGAGGTGAITYLWNNSQTTSTINNLTAGVYTCTITDANLCSTIDSVVVTSLAGPTVVLDSVKNVTCFGFSNGAVYITATGAAPFTYLWTPGGSITPDLLNVASGSYKVVVTDTNNCKDSVTASVAQPGNLVLSMSATPASCGLTNGTASLAVTGGANPYSYLWNNGFTTSTISNLAAGSYTVTVTDSNSCTKIDSVTVGIISGPVLSVNNLTHVLCNGDSTGAIDLSINFGTSPFSYVWSNGKITQDINTLVAGTYTCTVTDFNGCTDTIVVTVNQPLAIVATMSSTPASCSLANGSVTVAASGGVPGYTYLWNNGFTTSTIANLIAGTYTVTITDNNLCTKTGSVVVSSTSGPSVVIDTVINVPCFGGNNGAVDVIVTGGAQPYSFLWTPGNFLTQNISNLSATTYTLVVTDTNNCTDTLVQAITQPTALSLTTSSTPETCNGLNGSVTATASGGVGPYVYNWSSGATSGLPGGNYIVTVTDFNLCTITDTVTVLSLTGPSIATDSVVNVLCNGESTGAIYITASGGSGALSYLWSPGNQITSNLIGVSAGNYTVTVSDTNSCSSSQTFLINQSPAIISSTTSTPSACNLSNGTATVIASGGTGTLSFSWSPVSGNTATIDSLPPGSYFVTITDSNLCQKIDTAFVLPLGGPVLTDSIIDVKCFGDSSGAIYTSLNGGIGPYHYTWSAPAGVTSVNNVNIPAGVYTVTVTDDNGCIDSIPNIVVNQPQDILISISTTPAFCNNNNGSATAVASGGTPAYSYSWSSGSLDSAALNLPPGLDTVYVTDANGCVKSDTVTIGFYPAPSFLLDSSITVSCYGLADGEIQITPTGGYGPLTFLWSNGSTDEDLDSAAAGTYSLTITDSTGCSITFPGLTVLQNDSISTTTTSTQSACIDSTGTATVIVSGGTGTYTYLWNNGQVNQTATGLQAGSYTVTVADGNGCTTTTVANVSNFGAPLVSVSSVINVNCYGDSSAAIITSISGGATPYQFIWSNSANTQSITNIPAGAYTLTVTDNNQCTSIIDTVITQNDSITASISLVPASCGTANGVAIVTPSGGVLPYTHHWSNGGTTSLLTGLFAGIYTDTVTDGVGCTKLFTVTIINPAAPVVSLVNIIDITCPGGMDGAVNVNISGGTLPYTFTWQNTIPLQTTEDADSLPAGNYVLFVQDGANCNASLQVSVSQPLPFAIVTGVTDATCGNSNGSAFVTSVTGGTPGYVYQWSTGSANDTIVNLFAGAYNLVVTDSKGCKDSVVVAVSNITGPDIIITDSANVSCYNATDGFIIGGTTGGSGTISLYVNGNSVTSFNITGLAGGTYILTAIDGNNCQAVRTVVLTEPPPIILSAFVHQLNGIYNLSCHESNDGMVDLFVSGGVPYSNGTYQYLWSTSATTQNIQNLAAGLVGVTITDSIGCYRDTSFTLTEPPQLEANGGDNITVCGLDTLQLNAVVPLFGTGHWLVSTGGGVLINPDSANALITNLGVGTNILYWIVGDNGCADSSLIVITRNESIQSDAGIDLSICKKNLVLSAIPPQFGYGVWSIISGNATIVSTNDANATASNLSLGPNVFVWTVENGNCIDADTVQINLLPESECFEDLDMPTGITPNGDGINDYFVVRGLDVESNKLTIYNRWGVLVYEKTNYNNEWDGKTTNGQKLPDGTYYVIFKAPTRNAVLKGYVDLRR